MSHIYYNFFMGIGFVRKFSILSISLAGFFVGIASSSYASSANEASQSKQQTSYAKGSSSTSKASKKSNVATENAVDKEIKSNSKK